MFSFQEVELRKGEVVGREVRRALEARAAGGRALDIGILSWLKKGINQVSDKLIFSDGVGRPAVVLVCFVLICSVFHCTCYLFLFVTGRLG